METDTSLTENQTKPNQAANGDSSSTDSHTEPKQTKTTDSSPTDNQAKPYQMDTNEPSTMDNQAKPEQADSNGTAFTVVDLKPEKIEDVKEEAPKFHCELSDKEMVHKIALALLEGLSTACVDMTTGDIFRSPGTVAADVRKEMLDYLTERSQSHVAETVILDGGPQEEKSDHPFDIISDFIDDFLALKRGLLSRVSGWLLSDMREDKIDDFVQEMELNSFWLLDRREAVAQTLLKNVDLKNEFHCNQMFKTNEELEQHRLECGFRTVTCENEGCSATFSAAHMEEHDSMCPFKILPCEQKCPEILMRREMDRHCITVCPMKLVNCPFYSIGCHATVPSCNIREHCSSDVRSHLLYALQYFHKGASPEDLEPRIQEIEQESSGRLAGMQGVRTFTNAVKGMDTRLGPLKIVKKVQVDNVDAAKVSNASEQPNDKEEEAKTSDPGAHPQEKEKDTGTSDPPNGPPDEDNKDMKTTDSGEQKENVARLSDSGKHLLVEKEPKMSDAGKDPVDNERSTEDKQKRQDTSEVVDRSIGDKKDVNASNSNERTEDKEKDAETRSSGDHSIGDKIDANTSNSDESSKDKEKDAETPSSGDHSVVNEKDTRGMDHGEESSEKPEEAKLSNSGSGEHSAEQTGD